MKVIEIIKQGYPTQMYTSIHDDDGDQRILIIDDERGGKVELHGKEIGELYKAIKPPLAGR